MMLNSNTILALCVVSSILIGFSSFIIFNNPYTYPTKFWVFAMLGFLGFMVVAIVDKSVTLDLVRTIQLPAILIILVLSVVVIFNANIRYSYLPEYFIHGIVFMNGFALAMMVYSFIGRVEDSTTRTPTMSSTAPSGYSSASAPTAPSGYSSAPAPTSAPAYRSVGDATPMANRYTPDVYRAYDVDEDEEVNGDVVETEYVFGDDDAVDASPDETLAEDSTFMFEPNGETLSAGYYDGDQPETEYRMYEDEQQDDVDYRSYDEVEYVFEGEGDGDAEDDTEYVYDEQDTEYVYDEQDAEYA